MVTTRPLQHVTFFTHSYIPTTTQLWFSMYPAKLRIFQNVDLCVLTIHNLVIFICIEIIQTPVVLILLRQSLLPSPFTKLMVFVINVLNYQKLEKKNRNVSGSSLLFKLLSLGSFQNSKRIIKNYNFLLFPSLKPQIKCLGFKAHALQRYMQVFN